MESIIAGEGAEIIIVGGGIVGCAIAYHLAEKGHTDVVVLDRGITSEPLGSTGHAPGLLGRNSSSRVMAAMATYSAELYSRIPSNQQGFNGVGSLEVTRRADTLHLLARKQAAALANELDARLVSKDEIAILVPYINSKPLAGGLFVEGDGVLNVRGILSTLIEAAQARGVRFRSAINVLGLTQESDRVTGVVTDHGTIAGPQVVLAVGIWGRDLARKMSVDLPILPVQHPYIRTASLDAVAGLRHEAPRPFVRDLDNLFYLREHGDSLGYGWYNHRPHAIDTEALTKADIPYHEENFESPRSYDLFPILAQAPAGSKLNGVFSMTPDGMPLLGKSAEKVGLWIAEAVWITHAGAVGKSIAESLLGETPSFDIAAFNPSRFATTSKASRRAASLALYNDIYAWPGDECPL